ncbi:hypothetical protein L3X38_035211 [Prunus dulcis]|uniref:Uncharacterized protein n=1 Tax=Prunus dulcis TaxID=3755 RepID=A0AAD4YXL2_PRUDU|nr:hypothetical protein L3X38_035211 [Prunus dulcis]
MLGMMAMMTDRSRVGAGWGLGSYVIIVMCYAYPYPCMHANIHIGPSSSFYVGNTLSNVIITLKPHWFFRCYLSPDNSIAGSLSKG